MDHRYEQTIYNEWKNRRDHRSMEGNLHWETIISCERLDKKGGNFFFSSIYLTFNANGYSCWPGSITSHGLNE
jgi:hypothetical protein